MATAPRLFTSPSAFPNPRRVRLFMLEKGIEGHIEETIYDMAPGGVQRKWPHLKMNPWGESAIDQGLDTMWKNRVWIHVLYRIVTMFHVGLPGLGPKLDLTSNPQWGEHCRKEALAHAALVGRHLSDGREWLIGGAAPTFADITLCVAIAFCKFPTNISRWTNASSSSTKFGAAGKGAIVSSGRIPMATGDCPSSRA